MAKHGRQPRGDAAFRRPGPSRRGDLLLIVCEGQKTEFLYFDALRRSRHLSNVTIELERQAGQAMRLVERALRLRAQRRSDARQLPFDEVWCVMDREGSNEPAFFAEAVEKARRANLQLAISNPSFEYWYLLHFCETDRYCVNSREVETALQQFLPDYAKNQDMFDRVWPYTSQAAERAERLYRRLAERDGDAFPNPSTAIYLLIQRLGVT